VRDGLRRFVRGSLGCEYRGASYPQLDPNYTVNIVDSVAARIGRRVPELNPVSLTGLSVFVRKWLKSNISPLDAKADTSVENWLKDCPYPQYRKDELLRVYRNDRYMGVSFILNEVGGPSLSSASKCFIKNETYATFKHGRSIFSRSDSFKVFSGPWFRLVEKVLFSTDWFIKKKPVDTRAAYLDNRFKYGSIVGDPLNKHFRTLNTDYTAYESSFVKELFEIEFMLYSHVLQFVPGSREALEVIYDVLTGVNVCKLSMSLPRLMLRECLVK